MSVILRSPRAPALDRSSMIRVQRASVAYAEYKFYRSELSDPEDDEGPDNDDAWLFEDLHVLMRVLTKARDKEQLIELIFEVWFSFFAGISDSWFYAELFPIFTGNDIGITEGYRYHLLRTSRKSLQSCQYRRFPL